VDHDTEPCARCGTLMPAVLINQDERVVTMRSCARCDRVWWTVDGQAVDPTVLFARR
jgi:hypothetical protein